MTGPVNIAIDAWGADLPDWVDALARECAETSQNRVAARMNRSASLVSQVLRNKYAGDMSAVEDVFRGAFLKQTVECPALGTLPSNECRDWRAKARAFVNVNQQRVMMFRACNACPRNRKEAEA